MGIAPNRSVSDIAFSPTASPWFLKLCCPRLALVRIGVAVALLVGAAEGQTLRGGVEQNASPDVATRYLTDGQCLATCGAAEERAGSDPSLQTRTQSCLSFLDEAHAQEQAMLDLQAQSRAAGDGHDYRRRDELLAQAEDHNLPRTQAIGGFQDCVKQIALGDGPYTPNPTNDSEPAPLR